MSKELKPCPFCGGEAKLLHVGNGRIVKCQGCGTSTSFMAKDPVALWNGRTVASIKDTDLPATEPLQQIPRIRYTDASGKVHEGYYAFHVKRSICPGFDRVHPEDCQHRIVMDGFADWNLPTPLQSAAIDPDGGTIEFIGGNQ